MHIYLAESSLISNSLLIFFYLKLDIIGIGNIIINSIHDIISYIPIIATFFVRIDQTSP
jgi:hypothetical protein